MNGGPVDPASGHELGAVRVVDLTSGIGGAYCAKMFADAGADVITVEPASGHPLRRWTTTGPVPEGATGALFGYLKHGQRSVVDTDRDTVLDGADVIVVDDLDAGQARALAGAHPAAVVVAITPFGLEGPYAGRPASELTVQAESGGLSIRGAPDQVPFQAGGQITEWVTGAYAAAAALAAVRGAATSGRGEVIDVSWAEVANLTCTLFNDTFDSLRGAPDLTGIPPRSLETPSIEPTADGWVGFNTNARQQFEDFLILIERADLLADPSWAGLATRVERFPEWNAIVRDWTTKHTTAEIVERAVELRIPVAPIGNAPVLLGLDHAIARKAFVPDATGTFQMPRRPWSFDGEDPPLPSATPELGEHTGAVEGRARPALRRPAADAPAPPLPLQGLSVVDLTAWWAGPSASGLLAALGADVVHVESPTRPDGMRLAAGALFFGQPQWWERSHFFLAININKQGLAIRLDTPEGREAVLEMIATADVVIENFTPRVIEGFDLGWDVVHRINPGAVMVRLPAFGLTGPWRDRPGFAQTMEQATGLAWVTGHEDDQPRIPRGPCDPNGGMHAVFAALVALARRDRTGAGCLVEASLFESALAVAGEQIVEYTAYGTELGRMGNRSPHAAPQGVYACPGYEQWLAVSVQDDDQWAGLVRAVGAPEWAADPALATAAGRHAAHDRIDAELSAWAAGIELADAVAALVAEGVAAGAAFDSRRAREHPQFVARHYHERPDHPLLGPVPVPTWPFRFASIASWATRPAPVMGEHNHEVLAAIGYDDARIADLEARGIIGTQPPGF